MVFTVLLFAFLFILGLVFAFPNKPTTKKFLAWIHFLTSKLTPPKTNSTKTETTNKTTSEENVKSVPTSSKTELKSVFATFDKNKDGYITKQELKESFKNIGMVAADAEVAEMVHKVDVNGDGLIDFDEFCELFKTISSTGVKENGDREGEEDLREAFDVFDENKDGVITVEELGLVLSSLGFTEGKMMEDCKEMIRKVDIDGDGMVNFDEFKRMMKSGGWLVPVS